MSSPKQAEEMTELLRLMARMKWVSSSIVTPNDLGVVFTDAGRGALAQMYLVFSECGFDFTTSKQRCLKVLFDEFIDKEMMERLRAGDDQ